jgi:putative ABC transport system permease protein
MKRIFGRKRLYGEISDEIRAHLDEKVEELATNGMPREEAEHAARREFGNVMLTEETARETWRLAWLENFLIDIRYALRVLRKSPGFAAVAILTLALGIGANTAIFSVVDAALLHPLPYPHPGRIVTFYRDHRSPIFPQSFFAHLRGRLPAVEDLSAFHTWSYAVSSPGEPAEVGGVVSSADLFRALGIRPIFGRPFTHAEDQPGAAPVALISQSFWKNRFAGARSALGKAVVIAGETFTVVGVFPDRLRFPAMAESPSIWLPVASDPAIKSFAAGMGGREDVAYLDLVGRLKPGATIAQARAQFAAIGGAGARKTFQNSAGVRLGVAFLQNEVSKNYRPELDLLFGAVGLVLLIACANVANLLLARATASEREIAVRMALGAGKNRIARSVLIESAELSLAAGVLGTCLALLAVATLGHWIPRSVTPFRGITVNAGVLEFTAVVSVIVGILFGALPAWHASEVNIYATLKEGGRGLSGSARRMVRQGLVVAEVALAVMLLVGAGLLLRSFSRMISINPGFDADGIAAASVTLPRSVHHSREQWRVSVSSALDRLHAEPGVTQAAAAMSAPALGASITGGYTVAGQPPGQPAGAAYRPVTPGYFALMHIPLLAGRGFTASDSASSARVCVVNQVLVRASFRGTNPLGHVLMSGKEPLCRIVGVVGNVVTWLGKPPDAAIYTPFDQTPFWMATFLARGPQGTAAMFPLLRDAVRSVNPALPARMSVLAQAFDIAVAPERFRTALVGIFAGLAIVLAAIGISGVLGYSVSRRRQEIGVRMALGASPGEVLRQVVGEGLWLVTIGATVGVAGALVLARFMRSLLYGIGPGDPLTYFGVAVLLLLVALAASYFPARRAMRVDPVTALRNE